MKHRQEWLCSLPRRESANQQQRTRGDEQRSANPENVIRKPWRKKQAGDIGLPGSKSLSQCCQWAFPVIENQDNTFENDEKKRNRCLRGVSVCDPAEENVENTGAQQEEDHGMKEFDCENAHDGRIVQRRSSRKSRALRW